MHKATGTAVAIKIINRMNYAHDARQVMRTTRGCALPCALRLVAQERIVLNEILVSTESQCCP